MQGVNNSRDCKMGGEEVDTSLYFHLSFKLY